MHHSVNEINVCDCKMGWNWLFDGFMRSTFAWTQEKVYSETHRKRSITHVWCSGRLSAYRTEEIDYRHKICCCNWNHIESPILAKYFPRYTHLLMGSRFDWILSCVCRDELGFPNGIIILCARCTHFFDMIDFLELKQSWQWIFWYDFHWKTTFLMICKRLRSVVSIKWLVTSSLQNAPYRMQFRFWAMDSFQITRCTNKKYRISEREWQIKQYYCRHKLSDEWLRSYVHRCGMCL